jgi:hypothetical protein
MNKPHKHAELIKAWADGAEIEVNCPKNGWVSVSNPYWSDDREQSEYRIKPKPDVVNTLCLDYSRGGIDDTSLIELTFDGETGKLKSAEVMK